MIATILIIIIVLLAPVIYNIIHKDFKVIRANIITVGFFVILDVIAMKSNSDFSAIVQLISIIYIFISTIVLITKMVSKYFAENRLEKYKCIGIIMTIFFFFLYLTSMSAVNRSLPAVPPEEYEEYMANMRAMTVFTRMIFEIPLINTFFMTMFENKEKGIKDPNMKGESNG